MAFLFFYVLSPLYFVFSFCVASASETEGVPRFEVEYQINSIKYSDMVLHGEKSSYGEVLCHGRVESDAFDLSSGFAGLELECEDEFQGQNVEVEFDIFASFFVKQSELLFPEETRIEVASYLRVKSESQDYIAPYPKGPSGFEVLGYIGLGDVYNNFNSTGAVFKCNAGYCASVYRSRYTLSYILTPK